MATLMAGRRANTLPNVMRRWTSSRLIAAPPGLNLNRRPSAPSAGSLEAAGGTLAATTAALAGGGGEGDGVGVAAGVAAAAAGTGSAAAVGVSPPEPWTAAAAAAR